MLIGLRVFGFLTSFLQLDRASNKCLQCHSVPLSNNSISNDFIISHHDITVRRYHDIESGCDQARVTCQPEGPPMKVILRAILQNGTTINLGRRWSDVNTVVTCSSESKWVYKKDENVISSIYCISNLDSL